MSNKHARRYYARTRYKPDNMPRKTKKAVRGTRSIRRKYFAALKKQREECRHENVMEPFASIWTGEISGTDYCCLDCGKDLA